MLTLQQRKDHHEGIVVVSLNNFSHLVEAITPTKIAPETSVAGGVVVVRPLFLELLAPSIKSASNPDMMPSPAPHPKNVTGEGGVLLNQTYVSRESIEGGIWTMSVLFCSCVCFGNVGRILALSGRRNMGLAHKPSGRKRNTENGAQ